MVIEAVASNDTLPARDISTHFSIEVTKQDNHIVPRHFAQDRVQVAVEDVFIFIFSSFSRGVDADDGDFDSFAINSTRNDPITVVGDI